MPRKPVTVQGPQDESAGREAARVKEGLEALWKDPKGAVVMLAVGSKGSGKTHFCTRMLRWALHSGAVDKLFMVVPTFRFEASGSYAWADEKRVFVCERYSPALVQMLLHRRDLGQDASRVALFIDDLAAADGESLWRDQAFVELVAVARHVRVNIVLAHHAVQAGHSLPTFIRQNLTHALVTRIASRKLLEQIYEEWISLYPGFQNGRHFIAEHVERTAAGPGHGILIDVSGKAPGQLARDVIDWWQEFAPGEGKKGEGEKKEGAEVREVREVREEAGEGGGSAKRACRRAQEPAPAGGHPAWSQAATGIVSLRRAVT